MSRPAAILCALLAAHAQPPAFDVASLKPVPPPSGRYSIDLGNTAHGKVTLTNVTLSECLRFAFKIYNDSQIAGPEWIKDKRVLFAIVGQAPPDTPRDQLRLMTLSLLTERFQLALHHEPRELSYLALVADKKGPKMRESKPDAPGAGEIVKPGRIVYQHVSPLTLAVLLSRFTDLPILDMTDLKSQYDVDLEWTPDNRKAPAPGADSADAAEAPSLFSAVREQLGLKLEARKGPLDVVVVDHAERVPTGN
jgi:uncharacterized protein (TIGR03435 family)